jgi:hypothetical protein
MHVTGMMSHLMVVHSFSPSFFPLHRPRFLCFLCHSSLALFLLCYDVSFSSFVSAKFPFCQSLLLIVICQLFFAICIFSRFEERAWFLLFQVMRFWVSSWWSSDLSASSLSLLCFAVFCYLFSLYRLLPTVLLSQSRTGRGRVGW